MKFQKLSLLTLVLTIGLASSLHAATITSGSASFTITQGLATSVDDFDALFSASTSRADSLSSPAPGNVPFSEIGNSISYIDPIRPFGVTPSAGAGRTPQATTLDFDPTNILGTWSTSTDSFGTFVSGGEQIGLTLMQRWVSDDFTGSLLYGDFALRYTGTSLVLTSNIDFANAAWGGCKSSSVIGLSL